MATLTRMGTADIYDDLQTKLITAVFAPGEKLKPSVLQGEYGCSANTIRDVLLRLSKVGLVEFEMQRGFRAKAATPEARRDVTKFRIFLESEGARLSMQNGTMAWEAQLAAAHSKLSHIETRIARVGTPGDDMELWSAAEWEFHHTLISACGSPLLLETYANIYVQFRQQMVTMERDFGEDYFRAIISEHQTILDAALARDAERCARTIYDHLKRNF